MSRKYKLNDWVIYIDKAFSIKWKGLTGISIYKEKARIIELRKKDLYIRFTKYIEPWEVINPLYDDINKSLWVKYHEIQLYKDYLKFKKWIKG